MASRMERYYKDELINSGRSTKNKDLYKQIEDLDNYSNMENSNKYTNIEGVATIEKENEIDISKVRELISNRESYNKHRQFRDFIPEEEAVEEIVDEVEEETKTYDINDILSRAKEEKVVVEEPQTHRSLNNAQYDFLKTLNIKGKENDIESRQEEKQIQQPTIVAPNKKIEEIDNLVEEMSDVNENIEMTDDDIGLLDDLKSNTMVGDASSIKKIIEEEKQNKVDDTTTMEIDKSFYTSSMGFKKGDFAELKNKTKKPKKSKKIIIISIVVILLLIIGTALFFILK